MNGNSYTVVEKGDSIGQLYFIMETDGSFNDRVRFLKIIFRKTLNCIKGYLEIINVKIILLYTSITFHTLHKHFIFIQYHIKTIATNTHLKQSRKVSY